MSNVAHDDNVATKHAGRVITFCLWTEAGKVSSTTSGCVGGVAVLVYCAHNFLITTQVRREMEGPFVIVLCVLCFLIG